MGLHTINRLQILIDCSAMRCAWLLSAPIYWGFFVSNVMEFQVMSVRNV